MKKLFSQAVKSLALSVKIFSLLFINNVVSARSYIECIRIFPYERVDMPYALHLQNFVDRNKYASLLDITEAIVDGRTKQLHRRVQSHVCIHLRRDVIYNLAQLPVKYTAVVLE